MSLNTPDSGETLTSRTESAGPLCYDRAEVICFAAHPDDETIGAGGQLPFLRDAWVVHATDGAPRDMADARAYGFVTREAYARARRDELMEALRIAGIPARRAMTLQFIDQECSRRLTELVVAVAAVIREIQPQTVLAPPYEGGHPDHDSLAFAVHTARRILVRERRHAPRIVEHALYHGRSGELRTGEFLPFPQAPPVTVPLSGPARILKQKMLECFTTQRNTLAPFEAAYECFRVAPAYDFELPPHSGKLFYENFHWGVNAAQWREFAKQAARELGMARS